VKNVRFKEVKAVCTGPRKGNANRRVVHAVNTSQTESRSDLDSHADTCVLGGNFLIYKHTGQTCTVLPWNDGANNKETNVPICQGLTAYDCDNGTTVILVVNEALGVAGQETTLLSTNQLRYHGLVVDDCSKHLSRGASKSTHSIYIPEQD
jgi:hypothetical protein